MDPQMQASIDKLVALRAKGPLPPQLEDIYQKLSAGGMIQPDAGGAPPDDRSMVSAALRKPKDLRPVERDDEGGFAPEMDNSGYIASHGYGATKSPGAQPMSPEDMAQHYAEQQALQEAGDPIGGASGGATVTRAADTEVRPWAQRTDKYIAKETGVPKRGVEPSPQALARQAEMTAARAGMAAPGQPPLNVDPAAAPLTTVNKKRGAPLTYRSPVTASDAEIMQMLQGLK